jgi:hypothetical protein
MPKIIVFTSGRSGSHLIRANLSQHFRDYEVVQTHNPMYPVRDNDICVVSRRRDQFVANLSMCVASKLDKFHFYPGDTLDEKATTEISENYFVNLCFFQKAFYKTLDQRNLPNRIDVDYEDLIANDKYLFSKFGVDKSIKPLLLKSPYNVYELVNNIDAMRVVFAREANKEISQQELDNYIAGVAADISDIADNHKGNRYYE